MATVINGRDVALQASSPRTATVNLGSTVNVNGTVSGNVTGTLNGTPVSTVISAAMNATANYFTTGTSDPTGGANGDAYYNSTTNVMWFNISGTWTKGGTVNASQITTGTLAAARIAANSITSDKINVSTLSAITANLGTVNAGNISGSANIDVAGSAVFNGSSSNGGNAACMVVNASGTNQHGIVALARASGGAGVTGYANSSGTGSGVLGVGTLSSQNGVRALNLVGPALRVEGSMQITSTTAVSNLNADMVDGYHAASLCSLVPTNSGTCTVSSNRINLFVVGTLNSTVQTRGTGNNVYIENISDERLKQDIEDEVLGLDFINNLTPRSFRMRSDPRLRAHGLIYQEVAKLLNDDNEGLASVNPDGIGGVDYNGMVSPIIKAIQEISERLKKLETRSN